MVCHHKNYVWLLIEEDLHGGKITVSSSFHCLYRKAVGNGHIRFLKKQQTFLLITSYPPAIYIKLFNYLILQHLIIEGLIMSTEEEEKRLYQCLRKYQTIIKQFDELVEMMDDRTRPPKRRKSTRGSNSSNDPDSANQPDNREVFVQTITRFLHELKSNPTTDPNCSTSNRHRG